MRSEPPLTSLVGHKDEGHSSVGYEEVLRVYGDSPTDYPLVRETTMRPRTWTAKSTGAPTSQPTRSHP